MLLVPSSFVRSLGISGMTLCQTSDFHEMESMPVVNVVPLRYFWMYGHVAHFCDINPAYLVVSVRDNLE